MKRTSESPRRSSRTPKANRFYSGETWIQDPGVSQPESPRPSSPKATQRPLDPPPAPKKRSKKGPSMLKDINVHPPVFEESPAPRSLFAPFSFSNLGGNAREIIEITDEEDPLLSMEPSVLREKLECTLCATKMRSRVFIPCGHFVACASCSDALLKKGSCPFCKTTITSAVNVKFD